MNTIAGAALRASANMSRTRAAPTPTIISTNSEAFMEKNGTPASPATAFARSVLPVPGGPTSSTPFGAVPPRRVYFCGFFRKSTISTSSFSASSMPATSSKVTFTSPASTRLARLRPRLSAPPRPPGPSAEVTRRVSHSRSPIISRAGPKEMSSVSSGLRGSEIGSASITTPLSRRSSSRPGPANEGSVVLKRVTSSSWLTSWPRSVLPSLVTETGEANSPSMTSARVATTVTLPAATCSRNSV